MPDQLRDQLTLVMQELLLKTHELAFEYSTLDCGDLMKCPLGRKCRELFKAVKRLNELVRGFTDQLPKTPPSTMSNIEAGVI